MHIVVGIKQTPDHDGPRESYEINQAGNRVEPRGIPPVPSLFDENALEAALRMKDDLGDVKITIISIGKKVSNAVMTRALAAGADELIKVEGDLFDPHLLDTRATAAIMAKALERVGGFDLILVGRQASDFNSGYLGIALGKILNIPCITFAQRVEIQSGMLRVNRVTDAGYETVASKIPAVVMVTNELGELRYPAMRERREARKKPVRAWSAADITSGAAAAAAGGLKLRRLYPLEIKTTDCRYIDGETPAEAGRNLAAVLLDNKILRIQ